MIAQDCEVIFIIFNDSVRLKSIIKPEKRASVRLFGLQSFPLTWLRGATQKLMSLIKINSYVNGILSIEGLTGNGCTTEYDISGHKNNSLVKKNSKHFRFEI